MDTSGMDAMIAERVALVEATYAWDGDAFPGSRQWRGYTAAWSKVTAWDMEHPEVLHEVHRREQATLAGRDILGM